MLLSLAFSSPSPKSASLMSGCGYSYLFLLFALFMLPRIHNHQNITVSLQQQLA